MHHDKPQQINDPAANYIGRVNRAMDYVVTNLGQSLNLDEVSRQAGFSPFHFHRVFKALVGETLNQFIKRKRLERALYQMSHAPQRSLTDVALDCGFASSSDFSRSFKQNFGIAPRAFDLNNFRDARREAFERVMSDQEGFAQFTALPIDHNPDGLEVRLRDLPARTVAYIRVLDPYCNGIVQAAYERLLGWASARGIDDGQWLGYLWDEPEIVALEKCRYDVALVVDGIADAALAVALWGEIGRLEFSEKRVAEVIVRGDLALEARAIDWLYKSWLPKSGYIPDDQPAFEAWIGKPFAHGNEYFEIAVQLAVKRI